MSIDRRIPREKSLFVIGDANKFAGDRPMEIIHRQRIYRRAHSSRVRGGKKRFPRFFRYSKNKPWQRGPLFVGPALPASRSPLSLPRSSGHYRDYDYLNLFLLPLESRAAFERQGPIVRLFEYRTYADGRESIRGA